MISFNNRNKEKKLKIFLASAVLLLAASLAVIGICCVKLNSGKNKITDLNSKASELQKQNGELAKQVSEQAVSISDLNDRLTFYATPEEGADIEEAAVSPEEPVPPQTEGDSHPNLYAASKSPLETVSKKTAYLTFDDGPSNLTPQVLDILDSYNAKATFFVIGTTNEEYQQYYNEIVTRGHTLAMHSYTHNYTQIYASVDAFLADYQRLFDLIYEKTGQVCTLIRFPGGSKNSYNKNVRSPLIDEMERRGFIYYDWNVSCGDGSTQATKESIYQKVIDETQGYNHPVILMHDGQGHDDTIAALPDILKTLSEQGYSFEALTPDSSPIQFPR